MALILLSGCANWEKHLEHQRQQFVGKDIENIYPEWGVPVGSAPLANGGKFLEFQYFRGEYECTLKAKVDPKGTIREIVSAGGQNGCITGLY